MIVEIAINRDLVDQIDAGGVPPDARFDLHIAAVTGLPSSSSALPMRGEMTRKILAKNGPVWWEHVNSRRVATRYDKLASSFLGFVQLATIRCWIRFVHTT